MIMIVPNGNGFGGLGGLLGELFEGLKTIFGITWDVLKLLAKALWKSINW